jgi:Protein of unknown function (DUF3108)
LKKHLADRASAIHTHSGHLSMPGIVLALLATLAAAVPASGKARTQSFSGDYSISYLGFTIGRSTFDTTFGKDTFAVSGSLSSAGLAQLFDDTQGTISSVGRFAGKATQAAAYRVDYTEGGKSQHTSIRFRDGSVTRTENAPPLKKRGSDWVPLRKSHLRSVADPLAATLVRAGSPAEVCGRTLRIYDGEFRVDLTLKYESSKSISIPGFEGKIVTCRVGFHPVAGYRQGRRALEFLRDKSLIRMTFAPLGTTGVYAPIHATIGTQIGTVTISAGRFETVK